MKTQQLFLLALAAFMAIVFTGCGALFKPSAGQPSHNGMPNQPILDGNQPDRYDVVWQDDHHMKVYVSQRNIRNAGVDVTSARLVGEWCDWLVNHPSVLLGRIQGEWVCFANVPKAYFDHGYKVLLTDERGGSAQGANWMLPFQGIKSLRSGHNDLFPQLDFEWSRESSEQRRPSNAQNTSSPPTRSLPTRGSDNPPRDSEGTGSYPYVPWRGPTNR